MALAIPFDTLAFAKELETAGVPIAQAEAQAKTLAATLQKVEDIHRTDYATKGELEGLKREREELATKGDLLHLERDIKELDVKLTTQIKELDVKFEARLKELELRMVIKLGSMILVGVGMMITANRLWPIPVQYLPSPPISQEAPASHSPATSPPALRFHDLAK